MIGIGNVIGDVQKERALPVFPQGLFSLCFLFDGLSDQVLDHFVEEDELAVLVAAVPEVIKTSTCIFRDQEERI